MKKRLIYAILMAMALTGCSEGFMTLDPAGSVSKSTLSNYKGVQMMITGMYARLYGGSPSNNLSNIVWGDCLGGDTNKASTPTDQPAWGSLEQYQIVNNNSYIKVKWQKCYEGIHRSNEVISVANSCEDELRSHKGMEKDFYTETVAEARFLKGLWHFEIIKMFGAAVPYVSVEDYDSATDPMVSNVDENGNYIYTWQNAADDLIFAAENLPSYWNNANKGRANKWAAKAYLAKLYLYWSSPYNGTNATNTSKLNEAKALFKDIIDNGVDPSGQKYKLAPDFETLFVAAVSDWTGESVFDVQQTISGTQTTTNRINTDFNSLTGAIKGKGIGFSNISSDLVHSYMVDANGLPMFDYRDYPQSMSTYYPSSDLITTNLDIYTDPRVDVTVGRFGVPYWDWGTPGVREGGTSPWIRDVSFGGLYLNKKMAEKQSDLGTLSVATSVGSTAKNFHLLRYADVLLMYAECCIRTDDLETAREYINLVRARAANGYIHADNTTKGTYVFEDMVNNKSYEGAAGNYRIGLYKDSFKNTDEAWRALRRERRLEFGQEGHLWFDLCRWGIAAQEINSYAKYEKNVLPRYESVNYNSKWICMPMPFDEINTMMGKLVQNENWK